MQKSILAELNPLEHVVVHPLFDFTVGALHVVFSNHMFMVGVATLLLLVLVPLAMRSPKLVPGGGQNFIESICVYLRDDMARPVLHELTDKYIGFIWTIFFFILTLNLLGMIPTDRFITLVSGGKHTSHLGGAATANIWVTAGLAMTVFVVTHAAGIREQGLLPYLKNIAPPAPVWLLPLIYPLELISHMVRPFTLAVRLFANMVAGHMVLATLLGLILMFKHIGVAGLSVAAAVALSFLELLVAFLQAYVFTFLATLYIGSSVSPEH